MKLLVVFLFLFSGLVFAQSFNPRDYFLSVAALSGLVMIIVTFIRGVVPALDGAARVRTFSIVVGVVLAVIGKAAALFDGGWAESIVFGISAGAGAFGAVDVGRTIAKAGAPNMKTLATLAATPAAPPAPNLIQTVIAALGAAVSAFFPETKPYYDMIKGLLMQFGGRVTTTIEGDEVAQIVLKDLHAFANAIKSADSEEAQRAIAATMLGELTIQLNNRFPIKGV